MMSTPWLVWRHVCGRRGGKDGPLTAHAAGAAAASVPNHSDADEMDN